MLIQPLTALYAGDSVLPTPKPALAGSQITLAANIVNYPDGRPSARFRLDAQDHGVVLRHGTGPGQCDYLGARDIWAFQNAGAYYLHYDGAGTNGWLCCLATSPDLVNWSAKGPVLELGAPGASDSRSASYGVTYLDGQVWHMFYLGTPHVSPAPDLIPSFPYLTMKAKSRSPAGPWIKQPEVVPFRCQPKTYYDVTASPGHIVKQGGEYLMFFSAASQDQRGTHRTLSIARTKDLNGPWKIDPAPLVPPAEQVENSSLYFEPANKTWFLFTDHIGVENGQEFTDAIWVYWSKDLNHWNAEHKAIVLDGGNCTWSKHIIGLPAVLPVGNRLAVLYDGREDSADRGHMKRDIGLAWLELPLSPPASE
jgi:predicted GH43/DUF377 family glycosyl hydrolase